MSKLVWISAHDYQSAQIAAAAGVDAILVGDSVGMAVYGLASTREVSLRMMLDHAAAVRRAVPEKSPEIIVDLPFTTYDNAADAVKTARAFQAIGIDHLKLEGGSEMLPQVKALIEAGFRVTGHLGLLPQSAQHFRVAATTPAEQTALRNDAQALAAAGITNLVLECVPAAFAAEVAEALKNPVIGIGAGDGVDGQVLVYTDLIGRMPPEFQPKFLRRFGNAFADESAAVTAFAAAVKKREFPDVNESY